MTAEKEKMKVWTTQEIIKIFAGKDDENIDQYFYDIAINNWALEGIGKQKWVNQSDVVLLVSRLKEKARKCVHNEYEKGSIRGIEYLEIKKEDFDEVFEVRGKK